MKTKIVPIFSTIALVLTLSACSAETAEEPIDETPATGAEESHADLEELETAPTEVPENSESFTESAVNAVYDAYNEDVIFTDLDNQGSYYEIEFYDPSQEAIIEVHVSGNDLSVIEEDNEGAPDSEKQAKIDEVIIDITDAIHVAETEGDSLTEEFELDEEDGKVVYQFDLVNDREFDISVTTGEIVDQD